MRNKWLYIFLLILWGGLIYSFSDQPYGEQNLKPVLDGVFSGTIVEDVLENVSISYAGSVVNVDNNGLEGVLEFFIRKGAHLFVFFVWGFLSYRLCLQFIKKKGKAVFWGLLFVVLFAALDEWHQMHTGGRTPLIEDVMLDSFGGLLGILVSLKLVRNGKSSAKKRKNSKIWK